VDRLIQSVDEALARKSGGTSRSASDQSTTAPTTPAAPAKSPILIAALAAVLLLIGGAATWQLKFRGTANDIPTPAGTETQATDDSRWAELKDTKDIGLLRGFIEQHPQSSHRTEAEQQVAILTTQLGLKAALSSDDQGAGSASTSSDDDDWMRTKSADTFDAYQGYLKSHPQGGHTEEARAAAAELRPITGALKEEPAIGLLPPGVSKPVDDGDPMCKRGEIKVVTGGDVIKKISRTKKCVPRDQFP
jgi:hypothetical protein